MAEEKKPEADKNAPKKAAAPRRTKAKTSSKPEVKAQTADTAAETANKTESQKEQIKETVSHKEEKVMTQEALGMVETRRCICRYRSSKCSSDRCDQETGKLCSNCTSPRRNRQNGGIKCKSLEEQSGG